MIIYSELNEIFNRFNQMFLERLGEQLNKDDIIFTLQRKNKSIGSFQYNRFENANGGFKHEISLNPEYFTVKPKIEILRVFCQELLNLYRAIHGDQETFQPGVYDEIWGEYMMVVGLMPSNTGKPEGKQVGKKMSSYILPDGYFLELCNQLAEEGLLIHWFDQIPSKYKVDDLMADLFDLRDTLGGFEGLNSALIEVPILKSKNIDVFSFADCLEIDKESKKLQLNETKAKEVLVIAPQSRKPIEIEEDVFEDHPSDDSLAEKAKHVVDENALSEEDHQKTKKPPIKSSLLKDDNISDNDISYANSKSKGDNEGLIPISNKEQIAEIIGIEKPKPPTKRNSFKYSCGCGNEITSNKADLRITCNSCSMGFQNKAEEYETNVMGRLS